MAIADKSGASDPRVQQIRAILDRYRGEHRDASVDVHVQNSVSIRIRIIDSDFKELDRVEREELIWPILEPLPDEVFADISMLLLLTPDEARTSMANAEFETPLRSRL